jgi:hypothetical protein
MQPPPTCPRCGAGLRSPGLWSSSWQCDWHGAVLPFRVFPRPGPESLEQVLRLAQVPVWGPQPVPLAWVISGFGVAGDERTGGWATVCAFTGPAPLGGAADLLLVAEEPGTGLGARYAGISGPDPGEGFDRGPPHAKVEAAGHPTALWSLPENAHCAAYVGEAKGLWLWALLFPAHAAVLLLENLMLDDLRGRTVVHALAYGALSPRLSPPPA